MTLTQSKIWGKKIIVFGCKAQTKANPNKRGQFGLNAPKRPVYALVPAHTENKQCGHIWANLGGLVRNSQF